MSAPQPSGRAWQRHGALLAGLLILALAAALPAVRIWRERQPVYAGHRLTHWLADLDQRDTNRVAAAQAAVRTMGTNAIPTLIRIVRQPDSWLAKPLAKVWPFLPVRINCALYRWIDPAAPGTARRHGLNGCAVLGATAQPAVPVVANLARQALAQKHFEEWMLTMHALGCLGRPAVPTLLEALATTPPEWRAYPLLALTAAGTNAVSAVPAVLASVAKDPDANWLGLGAFLHSALDSEAPAVLYPLIAGTNGGVRPIAIEALRQMAGNGGETRAVLMAQFNGQPPAVRQEVIELLAATEHERVPTARFMLRALDDPDQGVSSRAQQWLRERLSPVARGRLLASEPPALQERFRGALAAAQLLEPPRSGQNQGTP